MTTSLPFRDELTNQLTGQSAPRRLRGRGARALAMTGLSAGLLLTPALTSVAAAQPIPDATSTSSTVGKDDGADLTADEVTTAEQDATEDTSDDEPTSANEDSEDATSSSERSHKVSTPGEGDDETRTGEDGQEEITVTEDNVDSWWDKIMNWLTGDEDQEAQESPGIDDSTEGTDTRANADEADEADEADADVVRIQTLGDSIIDNDLGGARPALQEKFADVGVSIQWVGTSNESGPASLSSRATDAHWGESIADMLPDTAAWVKKADADVVMVSAGGNDLMHDQGEGIKDRWSQYLDTICGANPGVPIVAATNHQLNTKTKAHENELMAEVLNPAIEATDGTTVDGGCTVTVVDMDGVISDDELLDDLHLDQDGYADMAEQWFPALRTAINETSSTADTSTQENASAGEADAADRTAN
jgi:lysophospholipase L1-like esterase